MLNLNPGIRQLRMQISIQYATLLLALQETFILDLECGIKATFVHMQGLQQYVTVIISISSIR